MFGEKKTSDINSVLVIGLGRFGHHAALQYTQLGCEVMAVDADEERINQIADRVNSVVIGDTTNEAVLKSLGVSNFDLCLVTIGSDFEASLITTALLKDLGAKFVIAKAGSELHAKFLLRNGADQVVYPEKEMAAHLAVRTTTQNVLDFVNLTENIGIFEGAVADGTNAAGQFNNAGKGAVALKGLLLNRLQSAGQADRSLRAAERKSKKQKTQEQDERFFHK